MKKIISTLVISSVVLVACTSGPKDEKQAFIDATVEATCMIFQSENIFDPALEDAAKTIYEDYGFDASDDAAMEALTKKYETDEDVQKAITDALEECAGDFLGDLESAFGDVDVEAEAVSEGGDMEAVEVEAEVAAPEEGTVEEEAAESAAEEAAESSE